MKLKNFSLFIISLVTVELSGQAPTNGVRPFDVLAKNSLKFNKFIINPTFSHVREDESFISFYNKRKWIGFDNSRTDYFFSLSSKFQDLNAYGIGLFQNNESIYSTFGIVANFARNAEILQDSNLTFGLNLAYVNSGINSGKIITNVQESNLSNLPKYSLISINPGINFGTGFFDMGIVANNLFYYNFNPSGLVQGNPAKNFGLHAMYTGYIDRDGILEKAKFSALGRAEIGIGYTGFGASLLFNAPKAGWIQAGYDSLNGINASIGFILAKRISIGYGVEKPLGNIANFGLSHEFTLAYKLKGYGDYEDEQPIVKSSNKTNPKANDKAVAVKKKNPQELAKERAAELALKQQQEKARLEAERLRKEKELAEAKAKEEQEARLRAEKDRLAALKAKEEAEARAKAEMEARLRAEKDKNKALSEAERQRQERLANEARLKAEAAAKLKAEQERLAKEKADALAREKIESERIAKEKADAVRLAKEKAETTRLEKEKVNDEIKKKTESLVREKAEAARLAKEKAEAESKAKAESLAREKAESERLAKEKAEAARLAKEKAEAESKAKAESLAREKAEAERLAKEKAEAARLAKEKTEAESKAKAESLAREKAEAERLAKEKAEAARLAKEKAEAESKAKTDSLAREKAEAERLAKEKAESESKAKAESLAREKAEAERLAKEKAEAERLAKEKAEAESKAKAESLAREKAESERLAKEKAEAARLAK
ncbi:PorP/SprF family type IX secretion system membrane protein, partial [Flavobacterium davisii]